VGLAIAGVVNGIVLLCYVICTLCSGCKLREPSTVLAFIFMYKKWPFPVPVSINTIVMSDRTVLSICKQ
jgi:hypothetical protein